jgi:hypothetical protein
MTKQEAVDGMAKIFANRLMAQTTGDWAWAQKGIQAVPAALGATLGSCCYQVDGFNVCIDGLTQAECESIPGGVFSLLTCAARKDCSN